MKDHILNLVKNEQHYFADYNQKITTEPNFWSDEDQYEIDALLDVADSLYVKIETFLEELRNILEIVNEKLSKMKPSFFKTLVGKRALLQKWNSNGNYPNLLLV